MLPDLRRIALQKPTGAFREALCFDNPKIIPGKLLTDIIEVARDHACLFSCLLECWTRATWLTKHRHWVPITTAQEMRNAICDYMEQNTERFAEHQCDIRTFLKKKTKPYNPWDGSGVTDEEAIHQYTAFMRDSKEWGGYPEMDAAAMLLGVVVHVFTVDEHDDPYRLARLSASFFPLDSMLENEDLVRRETKFVLINRCSHFSCVIPQAPKALRDTLDARLASGGGGGGGGGGQRPLTHEDIQDFLKNRKAKAPAQPVRDNSKLNALAKEREMRAANPKSKRSAIGLTDAQKKERVERSDRELAQLLAQLERQSVTDGLLARSLANS
jgi:hypothetical protein